MGDIKNSTMETEVSRYLLENPEFIVRHADLLTRLLPPGREVGEPVTDLQQVMVNRMRSQLDAIKSDHRELLSIGHANDQNLARIHAAALAMIEAQSIDTLANTICHKLPGLLGVDVVILGIESNDEYSESGVPQMKRFASDRIEEWLGPADTMLKANCQPVPELFDDQPVRSIALLRLELGEGNPPALLAFGSFDPEWFTPDQSTDMAEFLSGVASRCLKRMIGRAPVNAYDY